MKITRRQLRQIIENQIQNEGFSHSGPDPAYALSPSEIMKMRNAGIDVANKDKKSPEAQPYLDDTPYGGSVPLSRETELLASLEKLRLALRSGSDLGPDDRDALLDVVDTMLGVPPSRITEAYVDHRDDSPLEPATARLLADYIVVGFETRHGVTMDQSDREENIKILMYTMSRDPGVARRLYDTVREMEMDSDKHGKSLVGHHSGKPYGR